MASKTQADPTGQRTNRKRISDRLAKRLNGARRKVASIFDAIPSKRKGSFSVNADEAVVYSYDVTPEQMQDISVQAEAAIKAELETVGNRVPPDWWYKDQIEQPYRQGTAEELVQFNQLIAGAIAAGILVRGMQPQRIPAEIVLMSQPYQQALNSIYVRNYTSIKSLSETTASQVMNRIQSGVAAGERPKAIRSAITERFEVAKSKAKRIVNTEVNWAYNEARLNAVSLAEQESGLRSAVRHISALTATTRDSHAARHGRIYTVEQQRQWWMEGANLINCKCTTKSVLVDANGEVI